MVRPAYCHDCGAHLGAADRLFLTSILSSLQPVDVKFELSDDLISAN